MTTSWLTKPCPGKNSVKEFSQIYKQGISIYEPSYIDCEGNWSEGKIPHSYFPQNLESRFQESDTIKIVYSLNFPMRRVWNKSETIRNLNMLKCLI